MPKYYVGWLRYCEFHLNLEIAANTIRYILNLGWSG